MLYLKEEEPMEVMMRYIDRITRLAYIYREDYLKDYGLSGMHHTYITTICRNPGISQEALAQKIFVNKSNVARQVAFLEKSGYLTREASPTDKRKLLLYPTEKAIAVRPVIAEMLRAWNQALLEDFAPEERAFLSHALEHTMAKAVELTHIKEEKA